MVFNLDLTVEQNISARSRLTMRLSVTLVIPPVPGKTASNATSGKETDEEPSSTKIICSVASASSYPPPAQAPSTAAM